ncbi:MAG: pyruvate kinase [Bdellovibrionales bacterium]|nr:pyruvate kinase [Bdellovibrionales bacterium]
MLSDRRAKIVSTIGPASSDPKVLESLIISGVNVIRLNFSHGTHEDHLKVIQSVRLISDRLRAPVALLQDLQGPKIRVGKMKDGALELIPGEVVQISKEFSIGEGRQIPSDFYGLAEACQPGQQILLDDGLMELEVQKVERGVVSALVKHGGLLKDKKGMNVPGANLPVQAMTEKDLKDLDFGLSEQVDYVALSFVRTADDIRQLREIIESKSPNTQIVAKIEMLEAIENLEDIVRLSDAVMVARGDLAVEVGQTQLPALQKRIIRICNEAARPVITATQMLESMVKNPRPTRAEVTDVANAVLDGTDALMLSAETASGANPALCVKTMHEIILEVEKNLELYHRLSVKPEFLSVAEAVAESACLTAMKLNAKVIVSLTTSGKTARLISSYRPKSKILAITHRRATLNRLETSWGVQTLEIDPYRTTEGAIDLIEDHLIKNGIVKKGDKVVLTLGIPLMERGTTNTVRVFTVKGDGKRTLDSVDRPLRYR